jgi:hypothetical protein
MLYTLITARAASMPELKALSSTDLAPVLLQDSTVAVTLDNVRLLDTLAITLSPLGVSSSIRLLLSVSVLVRRFVLVGLV